MTSPQRLRQIRKALGMSQQQIAEALQIKQGSYSDVERGKASVSAAMLKKLVDLYQANPTFLLTGGGPMFLAQEMITVGQPDSSTLIPLFRHEDIGHYMNLRAGKQDFKPGSLSLPELDSSLQHYAFQVRQDMMVPTVYPGDIVVCRDCQLPDVKDNRVYVIFLVSGGWAVRRVMNRLGKDKSLLLKCDAGNLNSYPMPITEIDHVLSVERRITAKLSGPEGLYERLNKLEHEILDIKSQL